MSAYKPGQLSAFLSKSKKNIKQDCSDKLESLFSVPPKEISKPNEFLRKVKLKRKEMEFMPLVNQDIAQTKTKNRKMFKQQQEVQIFSKQENENNSEIFETELNIENGGRKKKKKLKKSEENLKEEIINRRTIFVGNVPLSFNKKKLKKLFKSCGKTESIRIRCAAPPKPTLPKKVAIIKNLYHPDSNSCNGYIVFETEEMATAALKLNGIRIENHHIRVDFANQSQQHDHKKSIFVGNLPYNITDEELWDFFDGCGEISSVRVIRDRDTRIGKGFGYVSFKLQNCVAAAVKLNGKELKGRELRIARSTKKEIKKPFSNSRTYQKKNTGLQNYQGTVSTEVSKVKKKKKIKERMEQKRKKVIANILSKTRKE